MPPFMPRPQVRRASRALLVILALAASCRTTRTAPAPARQAPPPRGVPERLSDSEFVHLVRDLSEPGGFFRSDNFLSNETSYQWVIPRLVGGGRAPGGVYLGVGPEQNFTYIVALRPRIAFVFDIRRQNVIQHLLYKALVERATDRADFLQALFSRRRPAGLDASSTAEALFAAYAAAAPDSALYQRNLADALARLHAHGLDLDSTDRRSFRYVYDAFFEAGPELSYNFRPGAAGGRRGGFSGRGRMPDYAELMTATDSAGEHRSYLATEVGYRTLRDLEQRNLIVPLVGDFAGPTAIRGVGRWLRAHDAAVSVFYTSNVEQYLFRQNDDWRKYYENVAALPLDSSSVFIRAAFNGMGYIRPQIAPQISTAPAPMAIVWTRSASLLSSIPELLAAYRAGTIRTYEDVVGMSK